MAESIKSRVRDAFRLGYYRFSIAIYAHRGFSLTHLSEVDGIEI